MTKIKLRPLSPASLAEPAGILSPLGGGCGGQAVAGGGSRPGCAGRPAAGPRRPGDARSLSGTVLRVYRNDDGTFTENRLVESPHVDWLDLHAATWADYDNDGDVDLLITGNFVGEAAPSRGSISTATAILTTSWRVRTTSPAGTGLSNRRCTFVGTGA